MSSPDLTIHPPDLPPRETLEQFASGLPEQREYHDFYFDAGDWRERNHSGVRLEASVLQNCILAKSVWRNAEWRDVSVHLGDLSGIDLTASCLARVEINSARLTGFAALEARLEYVTIRGAKLDYAIFQLARLDRCLFEKCDLSHATFEGATLSQVTFRDCNLSRARFIRARMDAIDLRGSNIVGLEIAPEQLHGLVVDVSQSPVIAALAGAVIRDRE